jgi:SulP family sulfate permease
MSLLQSKSQPASAALKSLKLLQRDASVGATVALTLLGASLASGGLVAGAFGENYSAFGAAAAISGAVFGGACAALLATSAAIMWGPLATISLVQAGLVAKLMSNPQFASDPSVIVTALFVCIALAGLLQVAFGASGLAKIVKYAPHPVVAGFINGVSGVILLSQIKPFFPLHHFSLSADGFVVRPLMLMFAVALTAFTFWFSSRTKKIPAMLFCLLAGFAGYYILRFAVPDLDLGSTIGRLPANFPPIAPVSNILAPRTQRLLLMASPDIVLFALAIVIVGTLQSLLAFRLAEKLSDTPIAPGRSLVALGVADMVCAATGGFAITVGAPMTAAAIHNGGRTRFVGLSANASLLLLIFLFPQVLGAIPRVSIVALLFVVAFMSVDRWSVRLFWNVIRGRAREERRRALYDLAVVFIVMGVTLTVSIIVGIVAGLVAACIIFVLNMSHPVVRRRVAGANARSNRVRTVAQSTFLREQGGRWLVLQIGGVLFFGNAEALSEEVLHGFESADFIVLDCRGTTDIDMTGATIIGGLVEKSRKLAKNLLFCNVPAEHQKTIQNMLGHDRMESIFKDLDSALESIEERVLQAHKDIQPGWGLVEFAGHEFLSGLDEAERDVMASVLTRGEFAKGAVLAAENDDGDRMWLIMKGSVNVCLHVDGVRGTRRIASLAAGTTAGEMALIEATKRSASLVAAEDVVCWELKRNDYDAIMREHQGIGIKLLTNLLHEMTHRLRSTSDTLRETEG